MTLGEYLEQKPLYYKEIDYERFPAIWEKYKDTIKVPRIIHIIGTNGKGSTGRFLAHYLHKIGVRVGHYSSPHLLKFNERIWLEGADASDALLEKHHRKLQKVIDHEDLDAMSYFEYTTLLAISIFEGLEFVVMEAGLGGEYDATAVFKKDLTIVTPIGKDHEAFLGNTIEQIAKTKLNAVEKFAILGKQSKPVYKIAKEYSRKRGIEFFRYSFFYTKEEMAKARRTIRNLGLPGFFVDNLLTGLAAAKFFGYEIKWRLMEDVVLRGRMQRIAKNVVLDVGHNPMAAEAIVQAYKNRRVILVYNSYEDKDYLQILQILKPIVKKVEILPIYNQRIEDQAKLEAAISSVGLPYSEFETIQPDEEYLVFGSFAVAEEFLKHYAPGEPT